MKLLHIVSSMDSRKGGVSQAVRNIIYNQSFASHSVVCLDEYNQLSKDDNFVIHNLGSGISGFQFHRVLVGWLVNHMIDYDVVVVHGIWQYHNFAVYLAKLRLSYNKTNVPKVTIMPHGMLDPYFQKDPSRMFKALRNKVIWKLTEKRAINSADAVLFTCEQELNLAKETFGDYDPKLELNVGLGVDAPPVYTTQMKIAFESKICFKGPYWLFLSRIDSKKGIDLLISSYKSILNEYPELPDLFIAGPLESEYAKKMQNLAKSCSKIHFGGMLTGNAKWGAFYGCDLFILPSHQENFGIAVVEALACNKPVLTTNKVNIWKEIKKGNLNIICDDNLSSLTDSLVSIATRNFSNIESDTSNLHLYRNTFDIKNCASNFVLKLEVID